MALARRLGLLGALLASLLCGVVWAGVGNALAAGRGANPCARAQALEAAKFYADAEQEYKKLLGTPGAQRCAPEGVARAHASLERATREAAKKNPPLNRAQELRQANRLEKAGFDEAAREIVKGVAKGSTKGIPPELRPANQRIGWWRELLGVFGPVLRLVLEIAAAAIGVVVAALLLWAGANGLLLRGKRAARLTGFTGSADGTVGDVLAAALADALRRMSDENAKSSVDWQSGTESKFEVPAAVTQALPQASLVAGLIQMLDKLLPRRLVTVSGTVHPVHEHRGAGLTLAVADQRGRVLDQVTIWEREFMLKKAGANAKDAVRYERLILPAAIWLGYNRALGFKAKNAPLGTLDWRSYAMFALGELVPKAADRRRLYERSLDRDSGNLGAHLNLASMLLRRPKARTSQTPSPADVAAARAAWSERLLEASRHLGLVASRSCPKTDPIWYRARYLQAWCHIYQSDICSGEQARHHGAETRRNIAELLSEADVHGEEQAVKGLVEGLRKPASVLDLIGELVQKGAVREVPDFQSEWLTDTSEYNVACFYSRYSAAATGTLKSERVSKAVAALGRASERSGHALKEARIDPDFDAIRDEPAFVQLVAVKPTPQPAPEKPTHYVVTLDAGPELGSLISGYRAPA